MVLPQADRETNIAQLALSLLSVCACVFLILVLVWGKRAHREPSGRFVLVAGCFNLFYGMTLAAFAAVQLNKHTGTSGAAKTSGCGLGMFYAFGFFGMLAAETALLITCAVHLRMGSWRVPLRTEKIAFAGTMILALLAGAAELTACRAVCWPADNFQRCYDHVELGHNICWIVLACVAACILVVVHVSFRRALERLAVTYDPDLETKADFERKLQIARSRSQLYREVFAPVRLYPWGFMGYAAMVLVQFSVLTAKTGHSSQSLRHWNNFVSVVYALKPSVFVIIYFLNAYASTDDVTSCWHSLRTCFRPGRRVTFRSFGGNDADGNAADGTKKARAVVLKHDDETDFATPYTAIGANDQQFPLLPAT
eukprot:m.491388 g.491388  ORF g.491388 m.491388 type:complete len:368 (+) comp29844_c0_seq1:440-1543(+)